MSDSKDQRLDAISGRDQMAEKPPTEEASRRFRTPACYGILDYLARQKAKRKNRSNVTHSSVLFSEI